MTAATGPGYVFVSYSRQDMAYVQRLVTYLRDAGLDVWLDEEVELGERWYTVIKDKIDECAAFVVVMTPAAEDSRWVDRELTRAERSDRPVVPLLVRGHAFLGLSTYQYETVANEAMPSEAFVQRLRGLTHTRGSGSRRGVISAESTHRVVGRSASFAPGGARLATAAGHALRIWDADSGALLTTFTHTRRRMFAVREDLSDQPMDLVAWAPDGSRLATVSRQRYVGLWDPAEGCQATHDTSAQVTSCAWAPDGERLLLGTSEGALIWTVGAAHRPAHKAGFTSATAWSPNGEYVATVSHASGFHTVGVWHVGTWAQLHAVDTSPPGGSGVAWSMEGTHFAAAERRVVRVFHTDSGALIRSLSGHAKAVRTVAYSPDGRLIATGGDDQTVRLWRAATGEPAGILLGHTAPVTSISWSGDSVRLAAAAHDANTLVWRVGEVFHTGT